MAKVFFSLGSSIGNKLKILNSAIRDIHNEIGEVLKVSNVFETEPWGFEDENLFFNMAIVVESKLKPHKILDLIHKIEKKHKRERSEIGYHSRTLDVDVIFYDDKVYIDNILQIPHKLAHKRKFVLFPLNEICPTFIHPLLNQSVAVLLNDCEDKTLVKKITLK
ncbi:MAG: 2-amino-4-hydroxy-6-hydroxymethyldihydropteridine diphosphokinase [Bacteroidales bacterium]|nr:2-amino-4-hydroxy-6-hydroxymethyldihydropteridine diphosphokinase [Bacteroidales bacterium]